MSPNFVLTSDHCVNGIGTPVLIVDATDVERVGRVCAKNTQARLALVCCPSPSSSVAALGAEPPCVGLTVDIESRTPRQPAWRTRAGVTRIGEQEFTIQLIPDSGVPGSGDSGSPAFVDGALVGILQEVRGERGEIAVYSAIRSAADWVRSSIEQQEDACTKWLTRG